ncbi:MAG: hypothetical protein ACE5JA_04645, partial [bacterium]
GAQLLNFGCPRDKAIHLSPTAGRRTLHPSRGPAGARITNAAMTTGANESHILMPETAIRR